jgi:hypothetical protein
MEDDVKQLLAEQFQKLPKVVQDAITSGHITENFQSLAQKHKLHVDQWQTIENLIMLTTLGLLPSENLASRIAQDANVSVERATDLVNDTAITIFQPIREELERQMGHPEAHEESLTDVEKVRAQVLAQNPDQNAGHGVVPASSPPPATPATSAAVAPPAPVPATPPAPLPDERVVRAPASGAYKPGEASTERKDIHDDPYRESPA